MGIIHVTNLELLGVATHIERTVKCFDPKQSNPITAVETGIGNCMSKAVIGAVLLEKMQNTTDVAPSIAWDRNSHPHEHKKDLFGEVVQYSGHVLLLSATRVTEPAITSLSFNPYSHEASGWEIEDFNNHGSYAEINGGKMVPTTLGITHGFVLEDWYRGGASYHEDLGIDNSIYHTMSRNDISSVITTRLDRI